MTSRHGYLYDWKRQNNRELGARVESKISSSKIYQLLILDKRFFIFFSADNSSALFGVP